MPKSKTRRPAAAKKPTRPIVPLAPEKELERKSLALLEASLEVVRDAETELARAHWRDGGEGAEAAAEVHLLLRTATLGIMTAYSRLAGLPDPADNLSRLANTRD